MATDFNPAEWIRISFSSDRTVQITEYNPFKPSMEMEIYIPRKTHPRLQKLVQHVISSKVTCNTEFQIYARGYMDNYEYENNRSTLLDIANSLYRDCESLPNMTEEDAELLGEMREEIMETFGIAWQQVGTQFRTVREPNLNVASTASDNHVKNVNEGTSLQKPITDTTVTNVEVTKFNTDMLII